MITPTDIGWLAGIIEGEGHIILPHPRVSVGFRVTMTDEDVVARAAALIGVVYRKLRRHTKPHHKPAFTFEAYGTLGVSWLMTLYPLFGVRRRSRTYAAISYWTQSKFSPKGVPARCGHGGRNFGHGLCQLCYGRKRRSEVHLTKPCIDCGAPVGSYYRRDIVHCSVCARKNRWARYQHHSPAKTLLCSYCPKTFGLPMHLGSHLQKHRRLADAQIDVRDGKVTVS